MDSLRRRSQEVRRPAREDGYLGSVHLTRFRIRPDRRSALISAARSTNSSLAAPRGSKWQWLVELEDGDWLDIAVADPTTGPVCSSAYVDLAEGVLGDEKGVIVASSTATDSEGT